MCSNKDSSTHLLEYFFQVLPMECSIFLMAFNFCIFLFLLHDIHCIKSPEYKIKEEFSNNYLFLYSTSITYDLLLHVTFVTCNSTHTKCEKYQQTLQYHFSIAPFNIFLFIFHRREDSKQTLMRL